MKNIVDTKKVERGARIAKIATFAGLGVLVAGMILSLTMNTMSAIWIAFGCLLVGLIVSSIGTMNMNRWVREPRADQALAQGLKGFDNRYRLYSYGLPVAHVLLSPVGLFVVLALGHDGKIRFDGTRFRRGWSAGRVLRLMADEGLGRPLGELERQIAALRQLLREGGMEEEVDVQGIIVFYNPRVQLDVTDPLLPIIEPKGLKKAIRKQSDEGLSNRQYKELQDILDQAAGVAQPAEDDS
ncbi:MAG: nuclease-related domain-containing protein [Anaerolineae bacterium]